VGKIASAGCKTRRSRWITTPLRAYCWCALALALGCSLSSAQAPKPTESQVKAAYLYNFGKFITWPADRIMATDAFKICVLGKDPFGAILDETVEGEKINEKKIQILRISRVQEAFGCNILFISSSEENHLPGIVTEAERMPVLTVSDIPHFAERGGTIGLVKQEDRVRFEVNRTRAEECHLGLSSELLKVAVKVIGSSPGKR